MCQFSITRYFFSLLGFYLPSLFWLKHEIDYIYINVASSVAIVKYFGLPPPTPWAERYMVVGRKAFRFIKGANIDT